MKRYLALLFNITLLLFSSSSAQNQIKLNPSVGIFIYNSENSLKIMEEGNYILNYGFEISYINQSLFGNYIQFDYSYIYATVNRALEFVRTSEIGPEPIGVSYVDVSLSFNTIDIILKNKLNEKLLYGIGPSFSIVNKSIYYDHKNFVDRLASFNIGINGTIDTIIPLSDNSTSWYVYGGIKLRYLYGLFYDKKGRDLSNYSQHFVTINLLIGLGYNF